MSSLALLTASCSISSCGVQKGLEFLLHLLGTDFFAALRIALLNPMAFWFMFSSNSCSPMHSSSANCLKLSQSVFLQFQLGDLLNMLNGVFWSTSMTVGLWSLPPPPPPPPTSQLRANFTLTELVDVVSCKCQIGRACGSPALGGSCGLLISISCWLVAQHSTSSPLLSRSSYPQLGEWLLKSPMMIQFSVVG